MPLGVLSFWENPAQLATLSLVLFKKDKLY